MIDLLNTHGYDWLRTFGLVVVQNTLFVAVVLLVLHWMRHAPARFRYALAVIGLVKLLLPPFIPAPLSTSSTGAIDALAGSTAMISLGGLGNAGGMTASASEALTLPGLLFATWMAGALGFLVLSAAATCRLRWRLRDATAIHAGRLLRRSVVRLYRSPSLGMPLCVGVRPRRIYVPAAWDTWSPARRRMVVRHEIAHIERHDGLVQALQVLAQSLYLLHPLVWILNRRLGEYREMACDDVSTDRRQASCLAYSRHLVEIAESAVQSSLPHHSASTLIRTKHELLHRIAYQLKEGSMSPVSRKTLAATVLALAALALPLSWYPGGAGPGASAAAGSGMTGHTIIELTLLDSELADVNGQVVGVDDLTPALEAVVGTDRERIVVQISCRADVTMGMLQRAQDSLRALGLTKVNYLTEQGKGLPLALPPVDAGQPVPTRHLARLSVAADGEVRLDESAIEIDQIPEVITERLAADEYLVVSIEASASTPYHDFIAVLGRVKAAGAPRIMVGGPEE